MEDIVVVVVGGTVKDDEFMYSGDAMESLFESLFDPFGVYSP